MKTYATHPPRKLQSESYSGPIALSNYEKFQWIRELAFDPSYFLSFFFAGPPPGMTPGTLELELLVTFATVPPCVALPIGAAELPPTALLLAPAPLSPPLYATPALSGLSPLW